MCGVFEEMFARGAKGMQKLGVVRVGFSRYPVNHWSQIDLHPVREIIVGFLSIDFAGLLFHWKKKEAVSNLKQPLLGLAFGPADQ